MSNRTYFAQNMWQQRERQAMSNVHIDDHATTGDGLGTWAMTGANSAGFEPRQFLADLANEGHVPNWDEFAAFCQGRFEMLRDDRQGVAVNDTDNNTARDTAQAAKFRQHIADNPDEQTLTLDDDGRTEFDARIEAARKRGAE